MTRSTTIANTSDYPSRDNMIPQSTTKTTSTQATKDSLPGKIGLSSTLPLPTSTNDFFSLPTSNSSSSDRTRSDTSSSQSSEPIRFKAFPYSGINEYMIFCQQGFLSLGGGYVLFIFLSLILLIFLKRTSHLLFILVFSTVHSIPSSIPLRND